MRINNNLFIYVKQIVDDENKPSGLACFLTHQDEIVQDESQYLTDVNSIYENVGQGSQSAGFLLMASQCDKPSKAYSYNNTCSSTGGVCFAHSNANSECAFVKGVRSFHSETGSILAMNVDETRIEDFIIAESSTGIKIKPGMHDHYDNPNYVNKIFVTALARPWCKKCYTNSTVCSN